MDVSEGKKIETLRPDDRPAEAAKGSRDEGTERRNLENELRSRAKQQEALAQLGERALFEPDLERLLNDAVSTVALTLSVDFVKILELLPGGTELLLRAGFGWRTSLVGSVLTSTDAGSYAHYTLNSAAPVVTADYAAETRFAIAPYLKDHHCVSGVTVTIARALQIGCF